MKASALRTEFGRALEPLMAVPGALGAVLSDDRGYAIDFVRDDDRISEIDLQIVGAQLGQPLQRLHASIRKGGWQSPIVVIETQQRAVLAGPLWEGFALAFLLQTPANVAMALRRFGVGRDRISALLTG